MCDNCKNPKELNEVKTETQKALKVIKALNEGFVMEYTISVLTGKPNPQIKMYRHEELEVFGIGKDKDEHFWNSLLRKMMLENITVSYTHLRAHETRHD